MINHDEKALESATKSHYLGLITTTACLIFICIICITSNNYTDTQIQMFKTILSITIPVTIGLAACYFITHIKTQKQLYVRAILYTSFISILAPLSTITLNTINIFIPVTHPGLDYLLTATLIIAFSIVEMHSYNKTIKKYANFHSKTT